MDYKASINRVTRAEKIELRCEVLQAEEYPTEIEDETKKGRVKLAQKETPEMKKKKRKPAYLFQLRQISNALSVFNFLKI